MNNATLKVGSKKSGDKFAVSLTYAEPTTEQEVVEVCTSLEVRVACFNRGWRIRLQENSGAREYVSAMSAKQRDALALAVKEGKATDNADYCNILDLVSAYIRNPDAARKSGRPQTPPSVELPATLSKKDAEKFAEILKSQGITVIIPK